MIESTKYLSIIHMARLLSICITISISGCILKRSVGDDGTYCNSEASEELAGLTKSEAIEKLGLPDETVSDERNLSIGPIKTSGLTIFSYVAGVEKGI